jgi:hypothetical protein
MFTCGTTLPFCSRKPDIGKLRSSTVPRSAPRAMTLANITSPTRSPRNLIGCRLKTAEPGVCHSVAAVSRTLQSPDPASDHAYCDSISSESHLPCPVGPCSGEARQFLESATALEVGGYSAVLLRRHRRRDPAELMREMIRSRSCTSNFYRLDDRHNRLFNHHDLNILSFNTSGNVVDINDPRW